MAVTISNSVQIGAWTWRITWTSDLGGTPTYYIYRDGKLVETTVVASYDLFLDSGESVLLEILDSSTALPGTAFPGRLTLRWFDVAGVDRYRVQEYVDSSWTTRAEISDDDLEYFTWESRFLEDVTSHQFRVVGIGDNGNTGSITSFTVYVVRHPDPPNVSYSYADGTQKLTISES